MQKSKKQVGALSYALDTIHDTEIANKGKSWTVSFHKADKIGMPVIK